MQILLLLVLLLLTTLMVIKIFYEAFEPLEVIKSFLYGLIIGLICCTLAWQVKTL